MKQIFRNNRGEIVIDKVPAPRIRKEGVLIRVGYSLISSGTESSGLIDESGIVKSVIKEPHLVSKTVKKIVNHGIHGIASTIQSVSNIKNQLSPLGYSGAGIVIETGNNITDIEDGSRVAYGGAPHAEIVYVPRNLVAKLPENVAIQEGAFLALGSIALQSIRRAQIELGETVVVMGLGLVGQLVSQLLRIAGCHTIGIDLLEERVKYALDLGLEDGIKSENVDAVAQVFNLTKGLGADAVMICAAAKSNLPVEQAMEMCREKGRVVVVGEVGMNLPRPPFYKKELDFLISRSYGPGRYDPEYEQRGVDYPIGYVRWTENRNMQEFIRLVSDKKIDLNRLITSEIDIEEAPLAYKAIMEDPRNTLSVLLKYQKPLREKRFSVSRKVEVVPSKVVDKDVVNVAVIGAGDFAKAHHLPNLKRLNGFNIRAIVTGDGINAKQVAKQFKADYCTTEYLDVLKDSDVDCVFICTRHNLHKQMVLDAAKSGKAIFVEKPLALSLDDCNEIVNIVSETGVMFTTGFNRRFSHFSQRAKRVLKELSGRKIIIYRVNAGPLSSDSWVYDQIEGGGRIVGETCHFFDLMSWLCEEEPKQIFAARTNISSFNPNREENLVCTVNFDEGSLGTLIYTGLGSKSFPKERVEIYCQNSVIVIDDFKDLIVRGLQSQNLQSKKYDKGHLCQLQIFLQNLHGKDLEMPDVYDAAKATECSLLVLDALRDNQPQLLYKYK